MMVKHLKQEGTTHNSRDLLKIYVKMGEFVSYMAGYETGGVCLMDLWISRFMDVCLNSVNDLKHDFYFKKRFCKINSTNVI